MGRCCVGAARVFGEVQSGLHPSNCRLLGAALGKRRRLAGILVVGFESGDHEFEPWLARALEITSAHGGEGHAGDGRRPRRGVAGRVLARAAPARPLRAARPGPRDVRDRGALGSVPGVPRRRARGDAARDARGVWRWRTSCRFADVDPDGPAPYYLRRHSPHRRRSVRSAATTRLRKRWASTSIRSRLVALPGSRLRSTPAPASRVALLLVVLSSGLVRRGTNCHMPWLNRSLGGRAHARPVPARTGLLVWRQGWS
jgi:hypothetical protein